VSDDYSCYCHTGDGESPEWMREEWRRARKEYKCCECLDKIVLGEKYRYYVGKWNRQVATFRRCEYCADLAGALEYHDQYNEGIVFGLLACHAMNNPEIEPSAKHSPTEAEA
jgi:hypothetical protein